MLTWFNIRFFKSKLFRWTSNSEMLSSAIDRHCWTYCSSAGIINTARIKQKSLVITLLDVKAAFGEVHHNPIPSFLRYHHIPDHMQILIRSLYSNFQTSIITNEFQTPFIRLGCGILQGDCSSPLTFNLCYNTFLHYISSQKFTQFRFSTSSLLPIHWYKFAGDTAAKTGLEIWTKLS